MTEPRQTPKSPSEPDQDKISQTGNAGASAEISGTAEATPAKKLTAAEQMALYEDDLKENDWGHQPC